VITLVSSQLEVLSAIYGDEEKYKIIRLVGVVHMFFSKSYNIFTKFVI